MESTGRWPRSGGTLLAGADGFLLAAGFDIALIALLVWGTSFLPPQYSITGDAQTPAFVELLSALVMGFVMIGGPLIVWRLRRRAFTVFVLLGMVLGATIGGAVAAFGFAGVGMLLQSLIGAGPNDPPYAAFAGLAVAALFFAVLPLIEAVRDLRREPPNDRRLDWLRIAAFIALVALSGTFGWLGAIQQNEAAEAGVFAVFFGAAAGFAVAGADLLSKRLPQPTAESSAAPVDE